MEGTEIRRINEKEIWIGESKDYLIHENIIFVEAVGEQTEKIGELQKIVTKELSKQVNGKVNYLIDLNKCGKNSPEARKIWTELSEEENTNKVATFGIHPVARVIASFVINISKKRSKGEFRFFKTKADALGWILEGDKAI